MNKILIAEDEQAIAHLVQTALDGEDYHCTWAPDGLTASDLLEKEPFDLVLLDIMLPGADGYEVLEYCRSLEVPVIFLTAKGTVEDRVRGLRLGAEDYITKPFELMELMARVETVLRRCGKTGRVLSLPPDIEIDTAARTVHRNGEPIALTAKEYDLLLLFVQNKNIALYRDRIYEKVWGDEYLGDSRTVDLHIQRMRKKLGLEKRLVAVYKVGYRLEVQPMKLFWKLFCSMVSITILACAVGGFVLIDGQFRASLDQEVRELYQENDMLRYILSLELESQAPPSREELSRLTEGIPLTTAFRLSDGAGARLGGRDHLLVDPLPLTSQLTDNQRGWRLDRVGEGAFTLHGASALSLLGETVWLENCRDVSGLFSQRAAQYQSFVGVMLALIAGVAALSLVVSHLILRPLTRLSAATRQMADGRLDKRVPVTSGDELGRLSADFNAMAQRLEEQVVQLTDAARREKDFTSSFAHEIKTPLTSIIGYADLLLSRPTTPELVRESAGYIFQEGKRLESLSRKLMDLIVLDKHDFPLRPVSMRPFLEKAGAALCPAMDQAGIQLKIDADDALIPLDPDLMETVCLNLLDNARKATGRGGLITLTGKTEQDGCFIQVADTGKGIPPEDLSRITEPFYMVDKSRARAQGGAGLGLSLCRRIVELHGGRMEFESVPGQGTTVRVHFKGGVET